MDSLDHLLSPRISQILALNNLACSRSRCWTSGAINKDTSIPDKDITFFIYLDTVENETSLWGLFMPNKSCLFFYLSILVIYSDTLLKLVLHKGPCLSQMQKCQVLEVFYHFSKFLRFCKTEHNFFFRQGHEANIKVMDIWGSGSWRQCQ